MTSLDMPQRAPGLFRRAPAGVNRADAVGLVRVAAPVAGLALVNMAMSVTDTFMTAAFGPEALAAVAVASDAYSIVFYLAVGCIGGLAPLYASAHAAKNTAQMARLRCAGWIVAALLAAPLAAVIWYGPAYLPLFGIDTSLMDRGAGYMRAMALTFPVMLSVAVLRTRLTAIERPGVMLRITLAALPLNALFNQLFMHGAFGFEGIGVTGAGVSSCLVGCLILLALAFESRRLGDSTLQKPAVSEIAEVLRIGIPIGVATLAEVGLYLGATLYVATLSVSDAAAHAVAIRLAGVTYALYFGLQQAATVRMARQCADGDHRERVAASALALGLASGALLLMIVLSIATPLSSFVFGGADPDTALIALALLGLLAVSDFFGPLGAAAAGLLRGLKVTRPVMTISLIGNWMVAAPVALFLAAVADMGAIGVWIGLTTGTVVTALLTVGIFFDQTSKRLR
ncbi:hypothetical protein K1W69_01370 [Hoeflea sp. WL0058]|uniref:Multidrug resistance protein NorM n=1 Tax=Flavimaribacter sediminis TaxID=2865987 RepID=A0AAE2ZJR7_9HYPH|nr:MATE family efflux transporter [Flavimaribacter sediminis]MBW8635820.1 hypothetical protein [Flavimaribacter sediminis]